MQDVHRKQIKRPDHIIYSIVPASFTPALLFCFSFCLHLLSGYVEEAFMSCIYDILLSPYLNCEKKRVWSLDRIRRKNV